MLWANLIGCRFSRKFNELQYRRHPFIFADWQNNLTITSSGTTQKLVFSQKNGWDYLSTSWSSSHLKNRNFFSKKIRCDTQLLKDYCPARRRQNRETPDFSQMEKNKWMRHLFEFRPFYLTLKPCHLSTFLLHPFFLQIFKIIGWKLWFVNGERLGYQWKKWRRAQIPPNIPNFHPFFFLKAVVNWGVGEYQQFQWGLIQFFLIFTELNTSGNFQKSAMSALIHLFFKADKIIRWRENSETGNQI